MHEVSVPLVAKFRTASSKYVYDANTGLIAKVDDTLFDALQEQSPFEAGVSGAMAGDCAGANDAANHPGSEAATKLGLFKPACTRSTLANPSMVRRNLGRLVGHFTKMTLELTERCNLRCRYCPYTIGRGDMRTHSDNEMSWETARKAINFFLDHLQTSPGPADSLSCVGLYGGEPCLASRLMRQCIEYVSAKAPAVRFTCTTNGTLLRDDLADTFAAHSINLLVSLDGPPEIHNRNRMSAGGGTSFDRVWANVNRLRERHPDYYRTWVRFEATVADVNDCERVSEFFLSHPNLFGPGQVRIVPSSEIGLKSTTLGRENGIRSLFKRYKDKLLSGAIANDNESRLLQALFERPYLALHHRRIDLDGIKPTRRLPGPCFPGFGRLFVAADGTYYLCEKLKRRIALGSVDRGIEGDQVMAHYDVFWRLRHDVCSRCWAIELCGRCYVHFIRSTAESDSNTPQQECRAAIEYWRQILSRYCSILEANPNAFDHLNHTTLSGPPVPDFPALVTIEGTKT